MWTCTEDHSLTGAEYRLWLRNRQAFIPKGPRGRRAAKKEDFLAAGAMMLPEKSQYDYLANLPEAEEISEAVNEAMKLIEEEYPDLGDSKGKPKGGGESGNPVEKLEEMEVELAAAILVVREFLQEVQFELDNLIYAETAMARLGKLQQVTNAVCLNETTRTQYEMAARDVFRKYKPDEVVKPYIPEFNAIEAIYDQLNQKTKTADISEVMRRLQQEVSMSVSTRVNDVREDDYVDLSTLDFDRLRAAFAKSSIKNEVVFDLQKAIEKQLEKLIQQNPIRLEFYEKYKKIIDEYNAGKDHQAVQQAFDNLHDFWENDLTPEMDRAIREGLDEETLAIVDLLRKPELSKKEEEAVKKVAKETLKRLKEEKLKIERWRESTQVKSQVKAIIDDNLQ